MIFTRNDNPASGHVTYKAREKCLRKKHGFRAFNDAQIKLLFASDSLEKLSVDARLVTWMGLYLGARVSEIGQLAVSDFSMSMAFPAFASRTREQPKHEE